jgi:NhaP-type Na+/H+ or K+/H+ antiporter
MIQHQDLPMDPIQLNTILAIIGGLLLILGLTSGVLKQKLLLSEPLVAMLVGILLGPFGLRILDIDNWEHLPLLLEQAARITLGIALIETALRLPDRYLRSRWKSIMLLLLIVMPLMWIASSMIIYALLGLPLVISFLIGAVLAPTDPIIASALVSGPAAQRNIPARIRHLMSAESGINDGLGYLFLMLPMLLMTLPPLMPWPVGRSARYCGKLASRRRSGWHWDCWQASCCAGRASIWQPSGSHCNRWDWRCH